MDPRPFLGPDGYVFGTEEGWRAKTFHNAWRCLFKEAGLPSNLTGTIRVTSLCRRSSRKVAPSRKSKKLSLAMTLGRVRSADVV
jgi:hypothetical protein